MKITKLNTKNNDLNFENNEKLKKMKNWKKF